MREGFPVTIVDLLASGVRPTPAEAAAIVLAVCQQVGSARQPAVITPAISSATVEIDAGGRVSVSGGPPVEDDQTLPLVGRLLLDLLPVEPSGTERLQRLHALARRAVNGEPGLGLSAFRLRLRALAPPSLDGESVLALVRRAAKGPVARPLVASSNQWQVPVFAPARALSSGSLSMMGIPGAFSQNPENPAWLRKVAVVGMTLLLLVGAGAAFLRNDPLAAAATRLRPAAHSSKPTQPAPAWELAPAQRSSRQGY